MGLTGGLACGKSTVGAMLVERGARLIEADKIAHDLMRPGQPVYYEVVRHFGPDIVDIDSSIDRAKLAAIAFPDRAEELNRIVHPAVIRAQEEWMEEQGRRDPHAVAVVEAALIVEAGVGKRFDKLVMVTCSMEQKVARFAERLHMDSASARVEVQRRMKAQVADEVKAKSADYVIDNSGSREQLVPQVDKLWSELHRLAEQKK